MLVRHVGGKILGCETQGCKDTEVERLQGGKTRSRGTLAGETIGWRETGIVTHKGGKTQREKDTRVVRQRH